MKTEKWMPTAAFAALLTITAACDDWGKQDPPAGNQVVPTLENVATYDFEAEEGLDPTWQLIANPGGNAPRIIEDDTEMKGGKVLEINGGYASLPNPLNNVVCQEAVSLTFWLYQAAPAEPAEGEEPQEQDLTSPIVSFVNETGNGTFHINANGGMVYDAADGEWIENDPAEAKTGYLKPGEWHYVAVMIDKDGYDWWVDGDRKVSKPVVGFDCSKIVSLANNVKTMTVGGSETSSRMLVDDLKVYRNRITAKETARPNIGEGGGFDYFKFDYFTEDPIFTVGSSDCSTGWWTSFSNYYRIPANTTMQFNLINHTSGGGNWNNWNICLSTDADRGAPGYAEYVVLRSDLYGWGDSYGTGTWESEGYGNWDQFRVDMEGAHVRITVTRTGSSVVVDAVATAVNGTVYHEKFTTDTGNADDVMRAFFICDGSYLEFQKDKCMVTWPVDVATPNVGASDNTSAWWTTFSDYFTIQPNYSLHLGFTNHTSGGGNWNNWNLCVSTEAERGEGGYEEYFVIRSDLYGWGGAYNGDNWSNTGYGNWDQFRIDMEGAYVDLNIARSGAIVNVTADAACVSGNRYVENFHAECGNGDQNINAFLIMDGSHVNLNTSDCYLYIPVYK